MKKAILYNSSVKIHQKNLFKIIQKLPKKSLKMRMRETSLVTRRLISLINKKRSKARKEFKDEENV